MTYMMHAMRYRCDGPRLYCNIREANYSFCLKQNSYRV